MDDLKTLLAAIQIEESEAEKAKREALEQARAERLARQAARKKPVPRGTFMDRACTGFSFNAMKGSRKPRTKAQRQTGDERMLNQFNGKVLKCTGKTFR